MRINFKLIIFFVVFVLCGWGFFISANAQTPPEPPWEEVTKCGIDQVRPKNLRIVSDDPGRLISYMEEKGFCSTKDSIEINSYRIFGPDIIYYCNTADGKVTPRDKNNKIKREQCCPNTHPNAHLNLNICCQNNFFPDTIRGITGCFNSSNQIDLRSDATELVVPADFDQNFSSVDPIVNGDGPLYMCPQLGCLLDSSGDIIRNNTDSVPRRSDSLETCVPASTATDPAENPFNQGADEYCYAGDWLTAEELRSLGMINVAQQCSKLDEPERTRCFDCFNKNPDPNSPTPQTYLYSSLGCIDTRRDPFITRLFQIGFGTLGGFAIVMIMWGAILRQSLDPAKIQEGRDKIMAAIAAIVMLATAIPLLRFIGINLTGLLPFSIF